MKKGNTDHDITCTHCGSNFSVAHGGQSDINDHLQTEKHKWAVLGKASKGNLLNFFPQQSATQEDLPMRCSGRCLCLSYAKALPQFQINQWIV